VKRIVILGTGEYNWNELAFVFPVKYHQRDFAGDGYRIEYARDVDRLKKGAFAVCVMSRRFRNDWGVDPGRIFHFLQDCRRYCERVYWMDLSDSSGTTQFDVLPYVDTYLKCQVLRDKRQYLRPHYGSRIFTDFYHARFGIADSKQDPPHLNRIPREDQLCKIKASWNLGMSDYGFLNSAYARLLFYCDALPRFYSNCWVAPGTDRPLKFTCRLGGSYSKDTVAFPRKRIQQMLAGRIPLERIARPEYLKEIKHALAGLSPFGYGEVCYRDFELTISGAALIKQDMSHLETWPDIWQKDMYIPFKWDFSDFQEKMDSVERDPAGAARIARNAQNEYKRVLASRSGKEEFCDRFRRLMG